MNEIVILDPEGVRRIVPYSDLQQIMAAGGTFASPQEQQKAIALSQQTSSPPSSTNTPFSTLKNLLGGGLESGAESLNNVLELAGKNPVQTPKVGEPGWARDIGKLLGDIGPAALGGYAGSLTGPFAPAGIPLGAALATFFTSHGPPQDRVLPSAISGALPVAGKAAGTVTKAIGKEIATVPSSLKNLFTQPNLKGAVKKTIEKRDAIAKAAGEGFEHSANTLEKAGVKIDVDKDLLNEIRTTLNPRTKELKELIKRSEEGDPKAIHQLQSDMWKEAADAKSSPLYSERNLGKKITELRDSLNESTENNLIQKGHHEAAHSYKISQDLWRKMNEIYHTDKRLHKIFHPDKLKREIPSEKSLGNLFGKDSASLNKFLELHPELASEVAVQQAKQAAVKNLGKIGAGGFGVYEANKLLSLSDLIGGD